MAAAIGSMVVEDFFQSLREGMKLGQRWGVEKELIEIRDILSSVEFVLHFAENMSGCSLELLEWVPKLKDAAFDVEDLLEDLFMEEAALRLSDSKVRRLFQAVYKLMFVWRMRKDLGAVVGLLRDIMGLNPRNFIQNIPAESREVHESRAIPFIGRDDEKINLMGLLSRGGMVQGCPVIQVEGGRGSGKTALVREVIEVSRHFDAHIWINASPPFDENRMAREIIASLTRGATKDENVVGEQLLHRVAKLLDERKKYLFVLDDLPVEGLESGRWLRFKRFLEGGASGSKILVTTRDPILMTSSDSPLSIGSLTPKDSLTLLLKTASEGGGEEISDPEKSQMAEQAAVNCSGSPLFIRAVGDYLSLQHAASDLSRFRDMPRDRKKSSLFSSLLYGGYPLGHSSPGVKRYNDLPPRIKQCFGICSLFPRGHAMDRQTLAELWIAVGYIKPSNKDRRPLEDIADDYFDRLLREEMFRIMTVDISGKVRSVTLQPDTEDLARSISGWECRVFKGNDFWWLDSVENPRHLSIVNRWKLAGDLSQSMSMLTRLRTLLHFVDDSPRHKDWCHYIIPQLKRTRVLDLRHMNLDKVAEEVWKLKHLRYLDFSGNTKIEMLPPAITGLLNLQTLKLSGCSALKELPRDMTKMVTLRHLYIDGCWKLTSMPMGLGDLKSLNILTDFILPLDDSSTTIDSADLMELCELNHLRGSLRITNLGCYDDEQRTDDGMEGLLNKKSSLESVELRFMNLPTDTSLLEKIRPHPNLKGLKIHDYGGTVFPKWMAVLTTHLPILAEIALIGCENCEHLPLFDQLRNLKSLTIQGMPDLVRMESGSGQSPPDVVDNAQPFGNLSSLCIRDCPKLEFLPTIPHLTRLTLAKVSEELFRHPCHLPNLRTLRLENIELLHHLPEEWLRDLTSLEELHIGSCPSLVSLSSGMRHLENLESLSIWNCKELDLSKDEQGNVMMELQGLKNLKFLTIHNASKLEFLPEWMSRAYTLRYLCIRSCPNLAALPRWLEDRRSLKLLELVHCPQLRSLADGMYGFSDKYPRKLNIVGCPLLKCEGIEYSRRL